MLRRYPGSENEKAFQVAFINDESHDVIDNHYLKKFDPRDPSKRQFVKGTVRKLLLMNLWKMLCLVFIIFFNASAVQLAE